MHLGGCNAPTIRGWAPDTCTHQPTIATLSRVRSAKGWPPLRPQSLFQYHRLAPFSLPLTPAPLPQRPTANAATDRLTCVCVQIRRVNINIVCGGRVSFERNRLFSRADFGNCVLTDSTFASKVGCKYCRVAIGAFRVFRNWAWVWVLGIAGVFESMLWLNLMRFNKSIKRWTVLEIWHFNEKIQSSIWFYIHFYVRMLWLCT